MSTNTGAPNRSQTIELDADGNQHVALTLPPKPEYGFRAILCAAHDQAHPAGLVCEGGSDSICGDAHVGRDCGCDYFDLTERMYASELNPESYQ